MGHYNFKLPDVGEGIAESEIATWRVAVGEIVKEDQALVDMLTEKAAVEIPSPVTGRIVELRGQPGDKIAVGAVLVIIDTEGAAAPAAEATAATPAPAAAKAATPAAAASAAAPAPVAAAPTPVVNDKPQTSPAVRKLAREMGVDLTRVAGSGPRGRILRDDVQAALSRPAPTANAVAVPPVGDAVEAIRIIGMRRKIAEAMQRSKQRIPHFAYVEEVDVTELEALRQHLNEQHGKTRGKLTVLPFLMQALVKLRPRFPQINSNYDDEAGVLYRHSASHVGIAAQTPQGLVVPVVHHAERLDLWGSGSEIRRLAEAARAGKAKREELTGSTITITSLGTMGGIASTPVINAPEVAIVGVNKMVLRPMIRDGVVVPRLMMNLSSSFDHRIVDGYDAAEFIQAIKSLLEHPATLFMP
ncbi:dihydrolipoamide acetyltransferase family protein [Solimonas sp. SE-A11]|uniref:dihydrolipoamide acetyltransferase family protein n=1 Tax=Solimonas sp. SE-A11 TaxID=3054954 RepID=UPI00259C81F2|nr:dihydrolipoamide acetyltransferase family protein [Solimonas sp. SE-A11]MDM4772576.1 dihydrolipoamide acetyltransferase family protein [Solimonas sp. SE-A11]